MIEDTSVILADRFPEIVQVFEYIFDYDLSVDEKGRIKEGEYFQAFSARPIHFQLDLFDCRRLAPRCYDD